MLILGNRPKIQMFLRQGPVPLAGKSKAGSMSLDEGFSKLTFACWRVGSIIGEN